MRRTALTAAEAIKAIEAGRAAKLALLVSKKAAKAAEAAAKKKKHKDSLLTTAAMPERKRNSRHDEVAAAAPAKKMQKKEATRDNAAGALPPDFPFAADTTDHAETPMAAYEDMAPILRELARFLNKKPAALNIWDPFFCTGAAARRLAAVGFPSVHHRCEDFHAVVAKGSTPEHDILVTNPPYSADHLLELFEYCVSSGKPWALLLPWFVVKKQWFRAHADAHTVHYLCPRKRYYFLPPPSMVVEGRAKVTAPFETFWYLSLGSELAQRRIVTAWQAEHKDEEAGRCRLGVGFKKRRGTPGFHTLLDEDGLLIGRAVPADWSANTS
jgi:hypothetical protein